MTALLASSPQMQAGRMAKGAASAAANHQRPLAAKLVPGQDLPNLGLSLKYYMKLSCALIHSRLALSNVT